MRTTLITIMLLAAIAFFANAKELQSKIRKPQGTPFSTLLNINNMSAWYSDNGEMERNPANGNSGLTYPRATDYAIYCSGLMIGTIATDGISGLRITGFSYNKGFQAGAILGIRTGLIENPNDPNVRIWRIRRDYATADLKQDAAEYLAKDILSLTEIDIQPLRDQYKKDWQEWPAAKGAPFYDANNDGIYTPQFETVNGKEVPKLYPQADEPGIAKADQVIWYVCNDIGTLESPWKTKALGLEQQVTVWGYNSSGVPGNIIYKKFKLIYKGTAATPDTARLTQTYLAHWSDPDLGDAGDDYVGCDTTLSLGYVYNSKNLDANYRKFNLVPPSLGYDFLQGPILSSPGDTAVFDLKKKTGYKNLEMTSYIYFSAGGAYYDPPFIPDGAIQWYQMLRGLPPTPQGLPDPNPVIDPVTKLPTKFWLSGDPITRTGWIDGMLDPPGDRRMLQSSGPFTMAIGDTQEIVVGVVGGIGNDYLQSIATMKENDRTVQFMYNTLFESIPPMLSASVSYPNSTEATIYLKAIAPSGKFKSINGNIYGNSVQLLDDGLHNDGSANDGTFANALTIARSAVPSGVDITFTDSNNKTYTILKVLERVTTVGSITISNAQVLFDNINNNGIVNNGEFIHYTFTVKNNSPFALSGLKTIVSSSTEFAKEYSFGSVAAGGESAVSSGNFFTFRLPMNYSEPNYKVNVSLSDNKGNIWNTEWSFPVVQQANITDTLNTSATNVIGVNDAEIGYVIFDKSHSGEQYDIWFGGSGLSTRNWTIVKPISGSDYATVTANLTPADTASVIKNSNGSFNFTINDAKTTVKYSNFTIKSLSGLIESANIYMSAYGINGPVAYTFSILNNTIADNTWQIPDSLVDDFYAGNLFVNIKTALRPNGEVRGQIADGLIKRQLLPSQTIPTPSIFTRAENRLVGFSIFIAPSPLGPKSVQQIAPTIGIVLNVPNPEKTYSMVGPLNNWTGARASESIVEIRFLSGDSNYALTLPREVFSPTPGNAKYCSVPFAVYQDTTRVWPVIVTSSTDTLWNIDAANGLINGKPVFDQIAGIVDIKDGSNNDIRYYQTLVKDANGRNVPNLSATVKGRLMNGVNWTLRNISFVNEKGDGVPPATGTKIRIQPFISVKTGDIKSITLKTLGVGIEQVSTVPQDFSLSQNYPNPFNPTTKIEFGLPHQSNVSLKIYDIIGRKVATVLNEEKSAGRFVVEWNGKNDLNRHVASGVYFYKLEVGKLIETKKMLMLK